MSHIEYGISNDTPDTAVALPPNVAPKKQKRKDRGGRMEQSAAKSKQKYKDIAEDDAKFEDFAFALTGKTAEERTPEENDALAELREEMRNGEISPEVVEADPANSSGDNRLPPGARGAYISGEPGEDGRILLSANLRGGQLQRTSDEEQGEAVADRADELGITVADGDAGARVSSVANGRPVTREDDPDLFTDQDSDTIMVVSDGEVVEAEADAGAAEAGQAAPDWSYAIGGDGARYDISTEQGEMDYLASFDTDGNGFLSASELARVEGISEDQAKRLVKIYGMANNEGEYFIPATVETGFEGAGIDNMVNDGAVEIFTTGESHYATVRFHEISPNSASNAMMRAEGLRRYQEAKKNGTAGDKGVSDFTSEVYDIGMTAGEMGAASNAVFGDRKPLNPSNGHAKAIVGDFTGNKDGRVKADDLEDIFEAGAIQIKPPNGAEMPEDFVPISAHRGKRPPIDTPEDFINYAQKFDTDGKSGLSETEFNAAIKHYCGDDAPSDAEINVLYKTYSGFDPETGRQMTGTDLHAMFHEESLIIEEDGSVVASVAHISSARAQQAIFNHAAEQRTANGRPTHPNDIEFISGDELNAALLALFKKGDFDMTSLGSDFGTVGRNGGMYFSGPAITNMFSSERLKIDVLGGLIENKDVVSVAGHPPGRAPIDSTAPYQVEDYDRSGTATYGDSGLFHSPSVSDGQMALPKERTWGQGYGSTDIYVPEETFEPGHNQPGVYTPPEFRNPHHGHTQGNYYYSTVQTGRVDGSGMHRNDNGNGTVTWTVEGIKHTIPAGSKQDQYFMDYWSFSTPSAKHLEGSQKGESNHLEGHPNLEMVYSYTDESGNLVEVWAPRDHQFRTNASGKPVAIETQPVVTVNGVVQTPSRMFFGPSVVDAELVVGFEVQNPDYDPNDPSSEKTKTYFMKVDGANMSPESGKAFANLAKAFASGDNLTTVTEIAMDPTDPASDDYEEFEAERVEGEGAIPQEEAEDLAEGGGDALDGVLASPEGQQIVKDEGDDLTENGVMLSVVRDFGTDSGLN